jgi:glycosyltransferase involved in cell wall biosynthesis
MSEAHAAAFDADKEHTLSGRAREHRWLFVDGASAFGGHEVMLLRWLEELAAQGIVSPTLVARAGSQLAREGQRYATVLELPKRGGGRLQSLVASCRDALGMLRAALAVKPELCIVAEGSLLTQPMFAPLGRLLGLRVIVYVPLVQSSTSMGFGRGRQRDAIVRGFYANVPHGWITITQEQARDFRHWAQVRRPIYTLPNTVSNAIENRRLHANSATANESDTRLRVLVLGRIEAHQKGLDALIDFALAHPQLGSRMQLKFVGDGPYAAHIRSQLASDPLLASWVELAPWSAPIEAFGAHDVLLMSSRYEGVPLVMLEAMALGVPVVAPDLHGTRAFLRDSELFPRGDIAAAFRCLERLSDPELRRLVAQRNRATFESAASNAAFSSAVKALTEQLLQPGLAASRARTA